MDVFRRESDYQIHIPGEAQKTVCIHRDSPHDEKVHAGPLQRFGDSLKAGKFHRKREEGREGVSGRQTVPSGISGDKAGGG